MKHVGSIGPNSEFVVRDIYDFIDAVETQPAMYIGEATISALWHALMGFQLALATFEIDIEDEHPRFIEDFGHFVSRALGQPLTANGWNWTLLRHFDGDEVAALNAFFKLLREYRAPSR